MQQRKQRPTLTKIGYLFAILEGGKEFPKLHLSHAYLQLLLAEEFQFLVTMNTHKGYTVITCFLGTGYIPPHYGDPIALSTSFLCKFGDNLASHSYHARAASEFVRSSQTLGRGWDETEDREVCLIHARVEHLGHRISLKLLQSTESKAPAVANAPQPRIVTELRWSWADKLLWEVPLPPNQDSRTSF